MILFVVLFILFHGGCCRIIHEPLDFSFHEYSGEFIQNDTSYEQSLDENAQDVKPENSVILSSSWNSTTTGVGIEPKEITTMKPEKERDQIQGVISILNSTIITENESGHGIHVQNSTLFNDFQSPKISQSSGDKSSSEDKEFQGTPSTLNGGKKMTTDGLQQFEQAFKNFDTTELTLVPEGDQDSGTGDDDPVITPGEIPSIYMNATIKERSLTGETIATLTEHFPSTTPSQTETVTSVSVWTNEIDNNEKNYTLLLTQAGFKNFLNCLTRSTKLNATNSTNGTCDISHWDILHIESGLDYIGLSGTPVWVIALIYAAVGISTAGFGLFIIFLIVKLVVHEIKAIKNASAFGIILRNENFEMK